MNFYIKLLLCVSCILLSIGAGASPSFDCKKASRDIEKVICSSVDLSDLDLKLSDLYARALNKVAADEKKHIRKNQRSWLKQINKNCMSKNDEATQCLIDAYKKRNDELSLVLEKTKKIKAKKLRVLRVTPSGENVPAGRQVVIQFDQPVVSIGRMERKSSELPITIVPALNCQWRWISTSALACQLNEEDKMQMATKYKIKINKGMKSESGSELNKDLNYSFSTHGPKVTYTRFVNWLAPSAPLIQVTFNQPVTKKSVEKVMGISKSVIYPTVTNVAVYPDNLKRDLPFWMRAEKESDLYVDDQLTQVANDEARKVWLIEPVKPLPANTSMQLIVMPGLVSSLGAIKGEETRVVTSFNTYPEFEFVGIRCKLEGSYRYESLSVEFLKENTSVQNKETDVIQKKCTPLGGVGLLFSSPVKNSMVRDYVTVSPALDGGRADYNPWENVHDRTRLNSPHRKNNNYTVWLPENLKANEKYTLDFNVNDFEDEFGRKLTEAEAVTFFTSHRKPKLHLNHSVAVLEKNTDSDVPLYITNLDSINTSYVQLSANNTGDHLFKNISVNNVRDVAYAAPMGVRELIGDDSGVIAGSLYPQAQFTSFRYPPKYFIQVTPFQVHAKIGHFNSVVWVTDFEKGLAVESAKVTIVKGKYNTINSLEKSGHSSITNNEGLAFLPGINEIDPFLKVFGRYLRPDNERYFIKVEANGDVALMPLDRAFTVRSQGVYSRAKKKGGHAYSWGFTAQGVYKVGDTVDYKIYVRDQSNEGWVTPEKYNYVLRVLDPKNKEVFKETVLTLSEFGSVAGKFVIPKGGSVGWYRFELSSLVKDRNKKVTHTWNPMSILVSDFTPSPFKVSTEINGERFKGGDKVNVSSYAALHSGGPYTDAEIRLTARLKAKAFTTDNPKLKNFTFGGYDNKKLTVDQKKLLDVRNVLNNQGIHEEDFVLPSSNIYYGEVLVESAVKDDRGKFVASSSSADFIGRDRYVGLKRSQWLYETNKKANFKVAVVNPEGELVSGSAVDVLIERHEYKASRVKGPGNAYVTKNISEWVEKARFSVVTTDEVDEFAFTPKLSGSYRITTTTKDTKGFSHKSTVYGWASGLDRTIWGSSDNATLSLVPKNKNYTVGETARYLVKNPFPGAKALISIERYGVIDQWVETLDSSTPVIEFKVKENYLPGFYLSVVIVSPRVEKPLGVGKVDLGKPSYAMGYSFTSVTDSSKEIKINVETDKKKYKPRDTVTAQIHIDKAYLSSGEIELAVAVVDESVLALNKKGVDYYNPYQGFNRLDGLDVKNYSLISRLVGRQKFEKKGANPGGGAGTPYSALRDSFNFLSYWNPSVTPDEKGRATVKFNVPDNLTGWRIIVLAVTAGDSMGLGTTNFKVNKPTEIRPVMPNQLIEGDKFSAGFTVMNRTDKPREMKVKLTVSGPLGNTKKDFEQVVNIEPYKRKKIDFPIKTMGSGTLKFAISAFDNIDADSLEHSIKVNKRAALNVAANYGSTLDERVVDSIHVPHNLVPNVGALDVAFSASVIGNIGGAFEYVRDYKYLNWESILTKGVMASHYIRLKYYLSNDTLWHSAEQDYRSAINKASFYQASSGGMVYRSIFKERASPYLSAYTALAFNWLRQNGHDVPVSVESRLHDYLLAMLRKDVFPSFYSKGMASSVRAVALSSLAEYGYVSEDHIVRYASHVNEMDLFGKANFLSAALTVDAQSEISAKTLDLILSYANESGGKIVFSEILDDSYKYMLSSSLRANCAVLSALMLSVNDDALKEKVKDIPFKLVRSITQARGNKDHWENTQENIFCVSALTAYSQQYETVPPNYNAGVSFDGAEIGKVNISGEKEKTASVTRPLVADDAGLKADLVINKKGDGRMYYAARLSYALPEQQSNRVNAGIEIRREYSVERGGEFTLLHSPLSIKRGEVVRVDLFVSVPAARHFVIVSDSIPGGLEPINTQLATASIIDDEKSEYKPAEGSWWLSISDWTYYGRYFWSFYHKELKHDFARFYADYLPAGNYHLSYSVQAVAVGEFSVLPVYSEEMYDPDIFGKGLPAKLIVTE